MLYWIAVALAALHRWHMHAGVPDADRNAAVVSNRGQHCADFLARNLDTCDRLHGLHVLPHQHTLTASQLKQKASNKQAPLACMLTCTWVSTSSTVLGVTAHCMLHVTLDRPMCPHCFSPFYAQKRLCSSGSILSTASSLKQSVQNKKCPRTIALISGIFSWLQVWTAGWLCPV